MSFEISHLLADQPPNQNWANGSLWDQVYEEHGHWYLAQDNQRKETLQSIQLTSVYYQRFSQSRARKPKPGAEFSQGLYTQLTLREHKYEQDNEINEQTQKQNKTITKKQKLRGNMAANAMRKKKDEESRAKIQAEKKTKHYEDKAKNLIEAPASKDFILELLADSSLDSAWQRRFAAQRMLVLMRFLAGSTGLEDSSSDRLLAQRRATPSDDALELFAILQDIEDNFLQELSEKDKSFLEKSRQVLASYYLATPATAGKASSNKQLMLPSNWAEFQLQHCGRLLLKQTDPERLDDANNPVSPIYLAYYSLNNF